MYALDVSLFGKFCVQCNGNILDGFEASKVQELFCYLLLGRDRSHHREALADLLWENIPIAQSKRYLSKTLWQLQTALDMDAQVNTNHLLLIEPEWIQLNSNGGLWLDVDAFEKTFTQVQGIPGRQLNDFELQNLLNTVEIYQGELLEGWYQPWCLYERERLHYIYVIMLDKLMGYFEARGKYETSLIYGTRLLRLDQARERTHRRIMRLFYLAGDRTEALRQYERCAAILDEELGVSPAEQTKVLYNQIKADQLNTPSTIATFLSLPPKSPYSKQQLLEHLDQIQAILINTHSQARREIEAIKTLLNE